MSEEVLVFSFINIFCWLYLYANQKKKN